MIEHERSYVFTHEDAKMFLAEHGSDSSSLVIEDYYLGQGIRVRKSQGTTITDDGRLNYKDASYVFTRKTGNKADGFRFEFEETITESLAKSLTQEVVMTVKKVRKKIPTVGFVQYDATMDFIEEPMKLAILEIEANDEIVYPVPSDIVKQIFGVELKECPLCSYRLFNRHFGIAGGPSVGKTEVSKGLSHVLNTKYQANSFHVAEFATTFIQKYKKIPNFWEEFFIWHGQHEREHSADVANIVISDCPTFLAYIYLLHLPKDKFSASTALVLAKMYKRILFDIEWYTDIIFLILQNYKENSIRYQSREEALVIENKIRGFLDDHNIGYSTYDYTQQDQMVRDLFYIN